MGKKIVLEFLWIIFTAVLIGLFLLPVWNAMAENYQYYTENIIFATIFITFTRYIFLTKYTFFSHTRWVKILLILICIPLFFFSMDTLYDFQRFWDEAGFVPLMRDVASEDRIPMANYIKYQFLFFGTGAIITIILMPIRMVISIWRRINRNTV